MSRFQSSLQHYALRADRYNKNEEKEMSRYVGTCIQYAF